MFTRKRLRTPECYVVQLVSSIGDNAPPGTLVCYRTNACFMKYIVFADTAYKIIHTFRSDDSRLALSFHFRNVLSFILDVLFRQTGSRRHAADEMRLSGLLHDPLDPRLIQGATLSDGLQGLI